MSTRSAIAKLEHAGGYTWIYCHFDGYPSGKIPTLKHYDTLDKVDELLALGGLSILGTTIGSKSDFDNGQVGDTCLAYHRDRGEEFMQGSAETLLELRKDARNSSCEWVYVYQDAQWYYASLYDDKELEPISTWSECDTD